MDKPSGVTKTGPAQRTLTDEDLRLGKRNVLITRVACVIALVVCLGLAVYVFQHVPAETRLPYSGKYGRNGIPMPISVLLMPVVVLIILRNAFTRGAHEMGRGARIGSYILGLGMILGLVIGQLAIAEGLLIEGGAMPG